jgi:hypothetical protein
MVGSVRNLAEAVGLATAGSWLLLGGSGLVCLGVEPDDYVYVALWLWVLLGTGCVWVATGGAWRWRAALLVAWVPFVGVLLPGQPWLPWVLAPALIAPFVLGMGWLFFSHVRTGSVPWRRLRIDAGLIGALLLPAWLAPLQLLIEPIFLTPTEKLVATGLLVAWLLCGLVLLVRGRRTALSLAPGQRHLVWEGLAPQGQGDTWQASTMVGSRRLEICVQHDPVPVQTRLVLPLPELHGLTITPGTGTLGDPVLDRHVSAQGERALEVLASARGAWLQVIHGWGGTLREGVLTIVLEGDDPRRWVHLPEGASDEDALQQIFSTLQDLAR